MSVEALIIHLARAHERNAHVKKLISELPLSGHVLNAVDSRDLYEDDIHKYYQKYKCRPAYPFTMSVNEIACFLSHRKAWKQIVDRHLDAALIMEDDAEIADNFSSSLELALKHIDKIGFIRFPFRERRERGSIEHELDGVKLMKPSCIGLGLVAQLVSREAAIKLLDATEQFDRPVDTLLQMHWVTDIYPHSVVPGAVNEISSELGGTTLEKRCNLRAKLKREVLRPFYRAQIAIRSRI